MRKVAIAAAIGLALAAGTTHANEHKMQHMKAKFTAADKDGDGTLDKAEAAALPKVSKHFDAIDTDKDGTVSLEEIIAARKSRSPHKMAPQEQPRQQ